MQVCQARSQAPPKAAQFKPSQVETWHLKPERQNPRCPHRFDVLYESPAGRCMVVCLECSAVAALSTL